MSLKAELEAWAAALKAYDEEDFEKSLDLFSTIADSSKILTNMGLIYATLGEHEAAVEQFNAATGLDQYLAVANYTQLGLSFTLHSSEVLFNKGLSLIYLGSSRRAVLELEDASVHDSDQEPVMAGVPYLDDDADIVLRSSDGVHFHVHKLLLSKCSLVFADMFSLPQPKPSGKESTREERPVIQMAEDQHTLRLLLGFCYPAGVATVHLLKDIRVELGLTKKYQMPQTWKRLKSDLLMHVSTEPEKVFAISWSFEMKDVAVAAAKQSLHNPWFEQSLEGPAPPEFDYIPATAMYKLVSISACVLRPQ
ncbi:hypothetical protein EWM64_g3902 [Hericium alpestre]|uniref:BTB domain-containing protein n=1 Tax=Hericium alpestre TaxID=135208 RepID=A0A4Z0A0Y6_9AGAM|nr:hypothetical protein EWM64_g3902 [Hericium alpestre]